MFRRVAATNLSFDNKCSRPGHQLKHVRSTDNYRPGAELACVLLITIGYDG